MPSGMRAARAGGILQENHVDRGLVKAVTRLKMKLLIKHYLIIDELQLHNNTFVIYNIKINVAENYIKVLQVLQ